MEQEQKRKRWGKVAAIGGLVLVALLVLMTIGLLVGRNDDSGRQTAQSNVETPQNAADVLRQMDMDKSEMSTGESKTDGEPLAVEEADEKGNFAAPSTAEVPIPDPGTTTRAQDVPTLDTKTIKTAALTIEIEKGTFNDAYGKVSLLAEGVGGYVSDSRSQSTDGKMTSGTITIRVPNTSFTDVMGKLKVMGEVTAVSEQAQDVTEEYVDLESRIRNLRAQETVYLNLMAKAETIEESISVQRELAVIQQQIEQLSGRKNYLDNHVQFSTIQVTLVEPDADVVVDGDGWGFVDALSDAAHGVVDGLSAVIRFLGNALVYIVILAGLALLLYFLLRKRFQEKKEGS